MNLFRAFSLLFGFGRVEPFAGDRVDLLKSGMAEAERALGLRNKAKQVRLKLVPGKIHRGGERWGIIDIWGREVGGLCEPKGGNKFKLTVVCPPDTMLPAMNRLVHECGHVLLFGFNVPVDHHESWLREKGL